MMPAMVAATPADTIDQMSCSLDVHLMDAWKQIERVMLYIIAVSARLCFASNRSAIAGGRRDPRAGLDRNAADR